ncbi:uncharacterized protein BJ171DRAFT_474986 [Polychytrium aggregatum]|uniref:uncharacterized protein n=1 Tax=Polychytrium aggregatum TaxID=110093 RepID=UPI0022FF2CDA|nr:uncharacterized protein BJ171DRAFT_474986 [Polychytrium aggregatum]KAI9204361.1 hypothetical protein BJ171DRAFT_474986 [Polychytrium aggregatum]
MAGSYLDPFSPSSTDSPTQSLNPSLAPIIRRTRAETFSSFSASSKLFHDLPAPENPLASSSGGGRIRSGSLSSSLPQNTSRQSFGSALAPFHQNSFPLNFGASSFESSWHSGPMEQPDPLANYHHHPGGQYVEDVPYNLDFLPLDDDQSVYHRGAPDYGSPQHGMPPQGGVSQSMLSSHTLPPQHLYGPPGVEPSLSTRIRSLSINGPTPDSISVGPGGRPRSSTIAQTETIQNSFYSYPREFIPSSHYNEPKWGRHEMQHPPKSHDRHSRDYGADYHHFEPSVPDNTLPSRCLCIRNINLTVSASDLLHTFEQFGPIESLRLYYEKECAYLTYAKMEHALHAQRTMDAARIRSLPIRVGFVSPETSNLVNGAANPGPNSGNLQPGHPTATAGASIQESSGGAPTKSLWIGNISPSTDPAELEALFTQYGPIESARVLTHKNCGFVNFERVEDAVEARKRMNGKEIGGFVVRIGFAKVPGRGDSVNTSSPESSPGHGNFATLPRRETQDSHDADSSHRSQPINPVPIPPSYGYSSRPQSEHSGSPVHSDYTQQQASSYRSEPQSTPVVYRDGQYESVIPPLPEANPNRRVDQNRLRELRKKLESSISSQEVEAIYAEVLDEASELATDYIGNVVLQKIIDKGDDQMLLGLIDRLGPYMASIGIHKNGTWVIQKVIDTARTEVQMQQITAFLKPYTPPLLLDQFGNYVIQCCLRFGTVYNQFIFDAIHNKCIDIVLGRFGARSTRTCLESQFTTKRQQKHVAISIVQNAVQLCTNANGALLITWLLDTSTLPGRFRVLAPKLAPHVSQLCVHKLSSGTIFKLVSQRYEMDARDVIIKAIFFTDDVTLREVLLDHVHGVPLIQRVIPTCSVDEEKIQIADQIRLALATINPELKESAIVYRRLSDELLNIKSYLPRSEDQPDFAEDIVSPLNPIHFFPQNGNGTVPYGTMNGIPHHLPTPMHSPQRNGGGMGIHSPINAHPRPQGFSLPPSQGQRQGVPPAFNHPYDASGADSYDNYPAGAGAADPAQPSKWAQKSPVQAPMEDASRVAVDYS